MKIANPIARIGEEEAASFLQKKGYKIIERNFRKGYGEIDIIAIDPSTHSTSSGQARSGQADTLVFVEVKTRISINFGTPFEAITPWKLKSLVKTAQFYKSLHPALPQSLRIDAVSVKLSDDNSVEKIELLENISGF